MQELAGIQQPTSEAAKTDAVDMNAAGWHDDNLTPPEKFVKDNAAFIQDLPRFARGMTNTVTTHERVIVEQQARLDRQDALIEALAAAVDLKIPAASSDAKAFRAAAQADAVRLKLVRTSAETRTPTTPRNQSGGGSESADITPKTGESFSSLFRRVSAQSRK